EATEVETKEKNNLLRSPLAWGVTLFMGGQSLGFYTLIAWLPDILNSSGYNANTAGWMVFLMQEALILTTFVMPVISEKVQKHVGFAIGIASLFFIGFCCLFNGSGVLVPLWAIFLGIAGGRGFSLSMMFFTIRTDSGEEAAELS